MKKKRGQVNFSLDIFMRKKKGISPTVATILLVALVITIGLIIFAWFKSTAREAVTKFGDKNIELVCDDVEFDASYSNRVLYVSNLGNVPIYSLNLKEYQQDGYVTEDIRDISESWPAAGLSQGGTFSEKIDFSRATRVILIPILAGNSESGQKTVPCEEKDGIEIAI